MQVHSALLLKLGTRFWAFLLALTVLTHAVAPFEAPATVRHGSAFSAVTAETAVAPQQRVAVQRAVVPLAPPPMLAFAAFQPLNVVAPARFWPPQTAPPAPLPLAYRPAPRAPPLS
ncbi:hypothetical protein SAMN06272759_106241 [Novosphingobium sp. B1]|nr:hypothetical protein SAMN06272759_106241 [Novosphingobium sp. B1]